MSQGYAASSGLFFSHDIVLFYKYTNSCNYDFLVQCLLPADYDFPTYNAFIVH